MRVACLDLEGVLIPEVWIALADAAGIPALRRTTREEPDYDRLMRGRIAILRDHGVTLDRIQALTETIPPLEGAADFLERLRGRVQVAILSDTFVEFADPFMRTLGRPFLLCNSLVADDDRFVVDFRMRQRDGKRSAVEAFRTMGVDVRAAGDSFNDLSMLRAADAGALFRAPAAIRADNDDLPAFDAYDDLFAFLTE